ncbi:MAG TPA: saccharopine dehydrogenase NADP-binding domain-containing protein [Candidatus Baltobacteraceae bacterium]|nr:saccharopine dehydrogenase NADP-binding domain-containing protein [Candidatus Baltobacteraceae bacterium]
MRKKPNLMILGAGGGVAATVLHHLPDYRNLFGKLLLVDPHAKVKRNAFIEHKILDYRMIPLRVDAAGRRGEYVRLLKRHRADIVLDLTDGDTIPLLEATDEAGASFITTGLNAEGRSIPETVDEVWRRRREMKRAPHIICAGMNPGCVNVWARYGIERHGKPNGITHFEYDTSQMTRRWRPMVTWSIKQFLEEAVRDQGGIVLGRYKTRPLLPNALVQRVGMRSILSPIMPLKTYPEGFRMFHEECSSLSNMYDVPSQFVYAIHPKTMRRMIELYGKKGRIDDRDLLIGDNVENVLEGSDTIGVRLEYPRTTVYYLNAFPNTNVIGTNATYTQVAVGVYAALFTFLEGGLKNGAYFPEELYGTYFTDFVLDNMRVQEFVFRKDGRRMKLKSYDPRVTLRRRSHLNHRYII